MSEKRSKRGSARWQKFFPDGETPRYVRCYDNDGKSADRYFVVYTGRLPKPYRGGCFGVSMNGKPFHPQYGISLHCEFSPSVNSDQTCYDSPKYGHIGSKINFKDLPEDCRLGVLLDYCGLWDVEMPEWAHNHWRIRMRDGRAKNYYEARAQMANGQP